MKKNKKRSACKAVAKPYQQGPTPRKGVPGKKKGWVGGVS